MAATFREVLNTDGSVRDDAFQIQLDGLAPLKLLSLYADETYQHNMISSTSTTLPDWWRTDIAIPDAWVQKIRSAFLRKMPLLRPTPLATRRKVGFYTGFIKPVWRKPVTKKDGTPVVYTKANPALGIAVGDQKYSDIVIPLALLKPDPSPDIPAEFVSLQLVPPSSIPANAVVTVKIIGGNTDAKNNTDLGQTKPVLWNTDATWRPRPGGKALARTPLRLAGNLLEIENATHVEIGPQPAPSKKRRNYSIYAGKSNRYADAYGDVVIKNTTGAPLTTQLLYGDLRVWKPDPTDPTGVATVSKITLSGGTAGITVDRRVKLAKAEENKAATKKLKFVYLDGADHSSEGDLPVNIGGVYNNPGTAYEAAYVYTPEGDIPRTSGPMRVVGDSPKDTFMVSASAVRDTPFVADNATIDVWLASPALDATVRPPAMDVSLGALATENGGGVKLSYPATGRLDYAAWVRKYRGDNLINWRNWVLDPYDVRGGRTSFGPTSVKGKNIVPFAAPWDSRNMFRVDPFKPSEDPWEGSRITGSGTLEVDAADSTFLAVTGRNVSTSPATYLYDVADPMVTAVYLCQTGTAAGYNYSNIKDFTGTLKVARGHAMCVPTVIVGAGASTPEGLALIETQRENAKFRANAMDVSGANGARATISVCGDVTLPPITGPGNLPSRPSRVIFQSAYKPATTPANPVDFYFNQYPTTLKPGGSVAGYHGELVVGDYMTLALDGAAEGAYLGLDASATSGSLVMGVGTRTTLGAAALYDIKRPIKLRATGTAQGATHTLSAANDCSVRADIATYSGTPKLAVTPNGNRVKLLGKLGANAELHDGTLVLVANPEIAGRLEFAPLEGAATQSSRVLCTPTRTAFRGRQAYKGTLALGPNGTLRIGSV